MNDLFTRSWQQGVSGFQSLDRDRKSQDLESGSGFGIQPGLDMRAFNSKVLSIERDIQSAGTLIQRLDKFHEQGNLALKTSEVKSIREGMEGDVSLVRGTALEVKKKIDQLRLDNEENRKHPGCERNSATDRQRMTITVSLGNKLSDLVSKFSALERKMAKEHRETVERRLFTVTGEVLDASQVDEILNTGKSDEIFQMAVKQQGRGKALDVLAEMQERHEAVTDLKKSLIELQTLFVDMATLVEAQGGLLDSIENNVINAVEYQQDGNKKLEQAVEIQRNTRKWKVYGIVGCVIITIIVAVVIIFLLK